MYLASPWLITKNRLRLISDWLTSVLGKYWKFSRLLRHLGSWAAGLWGLFGLLLRTLLFLGLQYWMWRSVYWDCCMRSGNESGLLLPKWVSLFRQATNSIGCLCKSTLFWKPLRNPRIMHGLSLAALGLLIWARLGQWKRTRIGWNSGWVGRSSARWRSIANIKSGSFRGYWK